jgi:ADP-ribose pyrophosphatase
VYIPDQIFLESFCLMDLTEETISSDLLVRGNMLEVYSDTVRRPDGGKAGREWVKHPGASAVIAFIDDSDILLVRQFRYPPRREFLELPAGKLDSPADDPADVAARELEEETGFRAGQLGFLASSYPCIGYSNEVIHFFVGRDLEEGLQNLEEEEFVEVLRVPFLEAVAMARRGELMDMKTALGILMAHASLEGIPQTRAGVNHQTRE